MTAPVVELLVSHHGRRPPSAVLAEVPSTDDGLLDGAVRVGARHVGPGERFAFRVHKWGRHGYTEPTPVLEA